MENNFFEDNDINDAISVLDNYEEYYSDKTFFSKIKNHYKRVGKKLINLVIILFYTLKDSDTPKWAKTIVLGGLGYFIFPLDIIPDFIPVVGFTDDFAAITLSLGSVLLHIKEEHKDKAKTIIDKYFG